MAEEECCVHECCVQETDDQHVYRYRPVTGTSLNFSVQCANDAHLCLSPTDSDTEAMLQVFIGGWHNKKSGLRLGQDRATCKDLARVDTPDIVSGDEMRSFWLSWDNGHVKVGREGETQPFLSWRSETPLAAVGFVGFTTGWGACGKWKFHDESVFETHCDCHYHFRPAHGDSVTFSVKAANDAHIALTPGNGIAAPMYEIFIGGWNNQKSAIRYTKAIVFDEHVSEDMATVDTPDILSADDFRSFTISWADGWVRLMIKQIPHPVMEWRDPEPITVTHFGYRTKQGADGQWRFEV